jgi:hypothetical protein
MLVLHVAIVAAGERLEDVGGRYHAGWDAPTVGFGIMVESEFGLGTSQAEVTAIRAEARGTVVLNQESETLGDVSLAQPFDAAGLGLFEAVIGAIRPDQLHCTSAIFPDMR